jgi:hypothetical protein
VYKHRGIVSTSVETSTIPCRGAQLGARKNLLAIPFAGNSSQFLLLILAPSSDGDFQANARLEFFAFTSQKKKNARNNLHVIYFTNPL